MGDALGDSLITGVEISSFLPDQLIINGNWQAEHVFNSVPWHHWLGWMKIPEDIVEDITALRNVGIDVETFRTLWRATPIGSTNLMIPWHTTGSFSAPISVPDPAAIERKRIQ